MNVGKYTLCFWGSATVRAYRIPRFQSRHATLESAETEARRVHGALDELGGGLSAAHPGIVYGPGLGSDGRTVL